MVYMHFSKSSQRSKSAITMHPVSIGLTLMLFLLIQNFLGETELLAIADEQKKGREKRFCKFSFISLKKALRKYLKALI